MKSAAVGSVVYDVLGHAYRVLAGGPWRYQVQALMLSSNGLVERGAPFWMGASEINQSRIA